jgi:GAF domain-containing protein
MSFVDEESLLSEAVATNMKLAEQLDEYKESRALSGRRGQMMTALGEIAPLLADPGTGALPGGVMERLIRGAGRTRGSLLLFTPNQDVMQEREVVPAGSDPLNRSVAAGLGSVAYRLCRKHEPRVIEDLAGEVFFDSPPPGGDGLAGLLIAPLRCDGLAFGSLLVYRLISESMPDQAELEYWNTAATLIGLSLHWRALRKKLTRANTA